MRSALWALIATAIMLGCSSPRISLGGGRRILFSTIGTRPFQDYVYSILPDGTGLQRVLKPTTTRSYVFASTHSPSGPLLVTIRELVAKTNRVADRLYIYERGLRNCRPLLSESTPQAAALLSPDETRAVYCAPRAEGPRTMSLWIVDLGNGMAREAVTGDGATGLYPAWGSSGRIAFVRVSRSAQGLLTELMEISEEGGKPVQLLGPEDGVVSATYSADGQRIAVWTKRGLEILLPSNGDRRLAFKWKPGEDGYIYRSWGTGGLAWGSAGQIAFSLLNKNTGQSELWVVNQDGTDAKKIYATRDGQIVVSEFLN